MGKYQSFTETVLPVFHLDIDECAMPDSCHPNATCVNLIGSHNCTCIMGTTGDGFNNCEGIETRSIFQTVNTKACT